MKHLSIFRCLATKPFLYNVLLSAEGGAELETLDPAAKVFQAVLVLISIIEIVLATFLSTES